jgi:hypothetical protein
MCHPSRLQRLAALPLDGNLWATVWHKQEPAGSSASGPIRRRKIVRSRPPGGGRGTVVKPLCFVFNELQNTYIFVDLPRESGADVAVSKAVTGRPFCGLSGLQSNCDQRTRSPKSSMPREPTWFRTRANVRTISRPAWYLSSLGPAPRASEHEPKSHPSPGSLQVLKRGGGTGGIRRSTAAPRRRTNSSPWGRPVICKPTGSPPSP